MIIIYISKMLCQIQMHASKKLFLVGVENQGYYFLHICHLRLLYLTRLSFSCLVFWEVQGYKKLKKIY